MMSRMVGSTVTGNMGIDKAVAPPMGSRQRAGRAVVAACLALLGAAPAAGQAGGPIGLAEWDSAFFAWERGAYVDALQRLDAMLGRPGAERYHAATAELTGEIQVTHMLSADGRLARWSPDSRHAAWETGTGGARRTHVAAVTADGGRAVAVLAGTGAAFDDAGRIAYVAGPGAVIVRDLATGSETRFPAPGINPQSIHFRPGDGSVYVLAPTGAGGSDLYRLTDTAPERVTTGPGIKTSLLWITADLVLYAADRGSFVIEDVRAGSVRSVTGSAAVASRDGSTVAWLARDGAASVLRVFRAGEAGPRDLVRTEDALAAPALSPDGSRIVYQRMPREDWELYVVDVAAGTERRLTREIQHDVLPRFVDDTTVLAMLGEPRHRRSQLHDVRTGRRTRLFHNNSVRTVAPEYEWVVSPDGRSVLVVADRDGDTVSPERGVYMVRLDRRVTPEALRERVRAQLAAEIALHERSAGLFAGLEEQVRAAVADVSTDRAYRYAFDLYQFGSKAITQPGNAMAIEYIVAQLRQWGYEPELQHFESRPRGAGADNARTVRTANVVATLHGSTSPDVRYVVSSHFDSVEGSPGADDNTSGTAALLEAARVLAGRPQAATIRFAFLTGEESGLLGAREYARLATAGGLHHAGFINNDMVGFMNDQRLDNTIRYTNAGIRDVQHAAALLFTDLILYDTRYYRGTDAHALFDAFGDVGGGIGSYPILGNPHYHQSHDVLETISHQLVAEVAKTTVASLMQLANTPSRPRLEAATPVSGGAEVRWHALSERDVAGYDVEVVAADGTVRSSARTQRTFASVRGVPGDVVLVWAVNLRGARSWDPLRVPMGG